MDRDSKSCGSRSLRSVNATEPWHELSGALVVAICGDLVRPSLGCLVAGAAGKGSLTRNLARHRDPQGFARLRQLCEADPHVSDFAASLTLRRSAEIKRHFAFRA